MADSQPPGNERAEEFLTSIERKLQGGMVGLGIAMGMQTGLFEVMISLGEEPKTSQDIADAANLRESDDGTFGHGCLEHVYKMAASNQPGNGTAEEFLGSIEQKLLGGMVGLGIAMGMQTGLFEAMISLGEEPKTSQEIADAANSKERYVREWLGCMTSAGIVNFEPEGEKYWLPAHRANIMDLKGLALGAPILCGGFLQVAECFKKDGPSGVPYEQYPQFDELMGLVQGPFFREKLVQELIPSMPQLHKDINDGIQVLDVGCGEGVSTNVMAGHFPKSQFYGLDFSESALSEARSKAAEMGLTNVQFVNADIGQLPADWADKFEYVFMNFVLHDLSYPTKALQEIYRVLKPGGTFSVVETNAYSKLKDNLAYDDQNRVNVEFTYSLYNCVPTSLVQEGGAGLGSLWGREDAQKMLEDFKFEVVSVAEVSAEALHLMCRKP